MLGRMPNGPSQSIWIFDPEEEAAMSWFHSTSARRAYTSVIVFALMFIFPLITSAQTPDSVFAFASFAQQPPVKAIDESPHFGLSPEMQCDLMMAHQRYMAAIDAYSQGPADSPVLWNKMGIAYHHMFNLKEAEKDYERALKLNPGYPEALNNLGAVYYGQKAYHDAERAYKKAIKLSPKAAMFYSNLGTAYLAQGKYKKGAEAYRVALALDPKVFEADPSTKIAEIGPSREMATLNYLLAKTYAQAGRKDEALLYLRKALNEGFSDRKKLVGEKEFAILRDTPEFQRMVA